MVSEGFGAWSISALPKKPKLKTNGVLGFKVFSLVLPLPKP